MPAGPVSPSFPPTAENEGGPASLDSHPPSERKAAVPEPPPPHHRDGKGSSGDERRSTANGPATLQRTMQDAEPEPRRTRSRSPAARQACTLLRVEMRVDGESPTSHPERTERRMPRLEPELHNENEKPPNAAHVQTGQTQQAPDQGPQWTSGKPFNERLRILLKQKKRWKISMKKLNTKRARRSDLTGSVSQVTSCQSRDEAQ